MSARRLAWLLCLALMAVGSVFAHALAYRLAAPAHGSHAGMNHAHGESVFPHLEVCLAVCGAVSLVALGISLFHKNELVQSFESGDDWQLTTGTGISTMLAERLYSELKFDYNINNQPVQNRLRADRRLMVGVSYEW
jgi:hypothetical protein